MELLVRAKLMREEVLLKYDVLCAYMARTEKSVMVRYTLVAEQFGIGESTVRRIIQQAEHYV